MKKGPNPKLFAFLALGTVLGGGLLVFSGHSGNAQQRANVERLRNDAKNQRRIHDELAQSKKDLEAVEARLAHLEQGIPTTAYVPTMLKELEVAGRKQGIEILGLRPMLKARQAAAATEKKKSGRAAKKPYDHVEFELKGRGRYGDVMRFVRALGSFPKIVAPRAIDLQPKVTYVDNRPGPTMLEASIELRAFVFRDGQPPKEDKAAKPAATAMGRKGSRYEG